MTEVDPELVREGMRRSKTARTNKTGHMSQMTQRVQKEKRILEKQMREYKATSLQKARTRTYVALLNAMFLVYFRVLKNMPDTPLLPLALDGIAAHAHQINVELMNDLLRTLEQLLRGGVSALPTRLKCILAAYVLAWLCAGVELTAARHAATARCATRVLWSRSTSSRFKPSSLSCCSCRQRR